MIPIILSVADERVNPEGERGNTGKMEKRAQSGRKERDRM
jgi:hypothetical protein